VKKNFLLINCLIILLFSVGNVAASTVNYAILMSDNDKWKWNLNSYVELDSNPISDPTVAITNVGSVVVPYDPPSGGYWGNISNNPIAANGEAVTWSTDFGSEGIKTVSGDIVSDSIFQMTISTNLQIIGGTGSNPIIQWYNDFVDIDRFQIRVYDPLNYTGFFVDEIINNPTELTNNFDFGDIGWEFAQGKEYAIRIEAREYRSFDNLVGLTIVSGQSWAGVTNRSKADMSYSNPVPEPATMLLFGLGLLGLAGVNRKKQ